MKFVFPFFIALASVMPANAVELSLQRISSINPIPAGQVTRGEMPPPDGASVSNSPPPRPIYDVIEPRTVSSARQTVKSVPVPVFNPVSVSFCRIGGASDE